MTTYIIRRLLWAGFTLAGVSVVVFLILHLTGDPAVLMLPPEASPEQIADFRRIMGFDRPIHVQYLDFVRGLATGDFGDSLRYQQPAMSVVLERLPATLALTLVALALTVVIAIPLGVAAAVRPTRLVSAVTVFVVMVGQAVPGFFIAILMIYVFSVHLGWLPSAGQQDWRSYVLPSVTLAVYGAPPLLRLTQRTVEEVISQDYVRTASAKGLDRSRSLRTHVARNAAIPILTVFGVQLGVLLGGSVITETVFGWPGMGRLLVQSISNRDYPVVQAAVLLTAAIFLAINLVIDLIYVWIDPRIRLT